MTVGSPFLTDVCDAPDDDGPRLVYADWLDEHGDPRGEFVRVQLALAKLPPADPRRAGLLHREAELLARHREEWLAAFRPLVSAAEFRRGFVDEVRVSVWHFLAFADALFAAGPVRFIHLLDIHPAGGQRVVEAVLESPHVARLAGLSIRNTRLGDPLARALAAFRNLNGLRELHISRNGLGDDGAAALASSLPNVESLDLSANEIGEVGAAALADGLPKLRRLDLNENAVGAGGAVALARRGFDRLDLAGNRVGGRLAATARPGLLLQAERLDLADNDLTPADLRLILNDAADVRVRHLDLSGNPLGDEGLAVLAGSRHMAGLLALRVVGCRIRDAGVSAVTASPYLSRLTALDLSGNAFGDDGGTALLRATGLQQLRRLVLPGIGLSVKVRLALTAKYARGPTEY